jgi:hypothetical protein
VTPEIVCAASTEDQYVLAALIQTLSAGRSS